MQNNNAIAHERVNEKVLCAACVPNQLSGDKDHLAERRCPARSFCGTRDKRKLEMETFAIKKSRRRGFRWPLKRNRTPPPTRYRGDAERLCNTCC